MSTFRQIVVPGLSMAFVLHLGIWHRQTNAAGGIGSLVTPNYHKFGSKCTFSNE